MRLLLPLAAFLSVAAAASNLVFKTISVQMGAVGSDDDIRARVCDRSKCCTTKVLSNLLSGEWRAKKAETWDGSKLGNCSSILFSDALTNIELSLVKAGKKADGLDVTSLSLTGQVGADKKKLQTFKCGGYKFSTSTKNVQQTKANFCTRDTGTGSRSGSGARPSSPARSPARPPVLPTLQLRKLAVQVGPVGTSDDVRIRVCDSAKCCTTSTLSHTLGSEWVKNKLETWDGRKLGNCSSILLAKDPSLKVEIVKTVKKKSPLQVSSIAVELSPAADKKTVTKYKCGSYQFGPTDTSRTNICLNENTASALPTKQYKVNNVVVQMGNDGTNDAVSLEICNPRSTPKCCETGKLSSLLSDDWSKNDKETWKNKDLGPCKTRTWDARGGFDVAVKKAGGKDSLKVTNITLEIADDGILKPTAKDISKFACKDYTLAAKDTVKRRSCTLQPGSGLKLPRHKVDQVVVQMGNDGTNDPVSLEICEAGSALKCCDTGKLSSLLSDDWSKNDKETWKNAKLGACKTKEWDVCNGFDVAVKKTQGKDSLKVTNISLEMSDTTLARPTAKDLTKFVCKDYTVGATDSVKRKSCSLIAGSKSPSCGRLPPPAPARTTTRRPSGRTTTRRPGSPARTTTRQPSSTGSYSEDVVLKSFNVVVGSEGTNEAVTATVCSEDRQVCCETRPLSKSGSSNWARGSRETWPGITLGRCSDKSFRTDARTTISNLHETKLILELKTSDRSTLRIDSFDLETVTNTGTSRRFQCKKFEVTRGRATKECFVQFPKARAGSGSSRGRATTTRPPFRSGSG